MRVILILLILPGCAARVDATGQTLGDTMWTQIECLGWCRTEVVDGKNGVDFSNYVRTREVQK